MTRATRSLTAVVWAVVAMFTVGEAAGGRPFVIQASASVIRLGDYRVDWNATYAGALAALGPSSSCTLGKDVIGHALDPSTAEARWPKLGVVIDLKTYGTLGTRQTGCTAPSAIHVHTIRVTDSRWIISRGLHVGSLSGAIKRAYPAAKLTRGVSGWYRSGYWLVTRDVGGYEGIGGTQGSKAPVLVAETSNGRVTALVLVVGAEGD